MDPGIVTIVTSGIAAVTAIVLAVIQRKQGRQMKEVHHQVKNNHSTNLRSDIDWLKDTVGRLADRVDRDMAAMRGEISALQRTLIARGNGTDES